MNESEVASVLERAASRLEPDVDALVTGGLRRGRRRRRRRLAGSATGGLVAVVAFVWAVQPGGADRAVDPVAIPPSTAPSLDPAGQRVPATFKQIPNRLLGLDLFDGRDVSQIALEPLDMGERTDVSDGVQATIVVDGAVVTVVVGDFSVAGKPWSPAEACDTPGCRELPDGSWLWPRSGDGGDGVADDFGFRANWATVYTVDGWMINVEASNSDNPGAGRPHVVTEQPVLTPAEVESLATSDLWFG